MKKQKRASWGQKSLNFRFRTAGAIIALGSLFLNWAFSSTGKDDLSIFVIVGGVIFIWGCLPSKWQKKLEDDDLKEPYEK